MTYYPPPPRHHAPVTSRERLAGRLSLLAVAAVLLACVLLAGGCAPTKPKPDERATASVLAPPVKLDTATSPLPAKPGILSGIGTVFSTPAGIERRAARKMARASVPRTVKVKHGAFAWGPATATNVSGNKEPAAVGVGATVNNAEKKAQQQTAVGTGITQTQTPPPPKPFNWLWLLLIPAGYLVYRVGRKLLIPYA